MLAEQRAEQTLLANVGKVVEAIRTLTKGNLVATVYQIRLVANISGEKANVAVARALTDGRIEKYATKVATGTGTREVEAYRMATLKGRSHS